MDFQSSGPARQRVWELIKRQKTSPLPAEEKTELATWRLNTSCGWPRPTPANFSLMAGDVSETPCAGMLPTAPITSVSIIRAASLAALRPQTTRSSAGSHGLQHGFGRLRGYVQKDARRTARFASVLFSLA